MFLSGKALAFPVMLSDVRSYYGLARDFGQAGYFETKHSEQIVMELKLPAGPKLAPSCSLDRATR